MSINSITNILELENAVRDLSSFVTNDLTKLTKAQFEKVENFFLEKIVGKIASFSKNAEFMSVQEKEDISCAIKRNMDTIKEIHKQYKRAYAVRKRVCYFTEKYVSKQAMDEIKSLLKTMIVSSPKFKSVILLDTGEIINNDNYNPAWEDVISIRERGEEETKPESFDLKDKDILYFRGLKSLDACFNNIAKFCFQVLVEFEYLGQIKGVKRETTSVSARLKESTMGHRLRYICNGDKNIAGILEGVIFDSFWADYKKSTFKTAGKPNEASMFEELRHKIMSIVGKEEFSSILESREYDISPTVSFDLAESLEFFGNLKITSKQVDEVALMSGVFLNADLINKTVEKMKNIEYPMTKSVYEEIKYSLPVYFKFDDTKDILTTPYLKYSPQIAGRLTQKAIQGLKGDTKALMFNNNRYCNLDMQAAHISLRCSVLSKMLLDVKAETTYNTYGVGFGGKMLEYHKMSKSDVWKIRREIEYALTHLANLSSNSKEIREKWAEGLGISVKQVKQLINAMGNGATLENPDVKDIMLSSGFNKPYFDEHIVKYLIQPCKIFDKYVKPFVENIFSPGVKSVSWVGLNEYRASKNIISLGSVSFTKNKFDELRPAKISNYLLMALESLAVLNAMQDIGKKKKATRGVSVVSYEYDGILLSKEKNCKITDEELANYFSDRLNYYVCSALKMWQSKQKIRIKAVQKSF